MVAVAKIMPSKNPSIHSTIGQQLAYIVEWLNTSGFEEGRKYLKTLRVPQSVGSNGQRACATEHSPHAQHELDITVSVAFTVRHPCRYQACDGQTGQQRCDHVLLPRAITCGSLRPANAAAAVLQARSVTLRSSTPSLRWRS